VKLVDESRGNREIEVVFWYPALKEKDAQGNMIRRDAAPDLSGAPYPVVLTENSTGGYILHDHLASHGFVMAQITIPDHDDYFNWDKNMIDWPRDFVFVLDQIAANPPEGLEGVMDAENVGATGYSYGGDITLALSGVRIDPEYFLEHCKAPPVVDTAYGGADLYTEWTCNLAKKWDEFAAFAGEEITTSEDGLWQPVTDERIRAVMPMAAGGAWLYGERGLAAANRPALMIAATEDEFIPYTLETALIFGHLGAAEKALISFIGMDHMRALDPDQALKIKHFMTAFFGYTLQGLDEHRQYLSEDFVAQFGDLAWGMYQK
jgi:predicted dienelactone hydrolase